MAAMVYNMKKSSTGDESIEQGATYRRTFVYTSTPAPNITPVDLTGYTARMQFRSNAAAVTPLLSLTDVGSADGQIIIGGQAGTVQVYITDAATDRLSGSGVYDLELISPIGDVIRFIKGAYSVSPNITK